MMRSHSAKAIGCGPSAPARVGLHRLRRCCRRTRGPAAASARIPALRRSTRRPRRRPPRCRPPCSGRCASCSRRNRAPSSPRRETPAPIENSTALPSPPPASTTVSSGAISVGEPVGPIRITRSPGSQLRAKIGRAAHFEHDRRHQPSFACRPRRRSARGLPSRACVPAARARQRLEILQAIELAGPESSRRRRRVHDDFDDRRRRAARRARPSRETRDRAWRRIRARRAARPARPSPASARRSARPAWRSPSPSRRCPHTTGAGRRRSSSRVRPRGSSVSTAGTAGLARPLHRRDLVAVLVQQPEILAGEMKVRGILAREHGVGLRAGRDQQGPRRQRHLRILVPDAIAVVVLLAIR